MSQIADLSRSPDYYAARADEERRLAKSTTDLNARAIHMEMAERYAALARTNPARRSNVTRLRQSVG